jgi:hypothetical protein
VRDRLGRLYGRDYELRLERDSRTAETIATLRLPVTLPPRSATRLRAPRATVPTVPSQAAGRPSAGMRDS